MELAAAYADCRAIAKREAKNFYYGFMALPRRKSDAMCAMYAFMRRADDISDDESLPLPDRRVLMEKWLQSFRAGSPFDAIDRSVFLAVRDVQQRFSVEDALLEELVQGTAMDLLPEAPAGVCHLSEDGKSFDAYENVQALERYCYLVASVVGLVTIRIFGFTDGRANDYAVELGKAFQFTNILRDVKEDAERGRVYLPLDLLRAHGSSVSEIASAVQGAPMTPALHAAMNDLAECAEGMYEVESGLVPLLDADSRPAMRVLICIYHSLLAEIRKSNYQVFQQRIRVSTLKKTTILIRGMLGRWVDV